MAVQKISLSDIVLVVGMLVLTVVLQPISSFAASQEFPPTERTEVGTKWKVKGKVTAASTRPLSGVDVYLTRGASYRPMSSNRYSDLQDLVKSNFAGEFESDAQQYFRFLFLTPGFAPLNVPVPEGSTLDVQLETGRSISGTIKRSSGAPVANAVVTPVQWMIEKPKAWQTPPRAGDRASSTHFKCALPEFGKSWSVKTDSEGKFTIPNMPSQYRVGLSVKAEGWKEEVVFVRPDGDDDPPYYDGQIVVENEFTYKTEPCALMEIGATDESGTPVEIARVSIIPINNVSNAFDFRRTETFNRKHATMSIHAHKAGSMVVVEPVDAKRLMAVQLKLPPNGELDIIEKEIEFPTGKTIHGIVTGLDGKPIADVPIEWGRLDKPFVRDVDGAFPSLDVKTDSRGSFALAVPDVHGSVGVAGDIEGYCSSACKVNDKNGHEFAQQFFEPITYELHQGQLDDLEKIEFKLQPSYDVHVNVVDESGKPVPNCVIAWTKKTNISIRVASGINGRGGGMSCRPLSFTRSTDGQGKLAITDLYSDVFFMALMKKPDEKSQRTAYSDVYPIAIQAFSVDGFKQGQIVVPMPETKSDTNVIPVTLKLLLGGSVLGRVVDQAEKGIADLAVTAKGGDQAGQSWTTKTRKDGWFKMEGIPVGGNLKWTLDGTRVKSTGSRGRIKVDTSQLANGEVLKLEQPFTCQDFTALAEELPDLKIDGLSDEEALAAIVEYVRSNYSRIPMPKDRRQRMLFGGGSSTDPVPVFIGKVIGKARPAIEKLADLEPGSDFEFKLLTDSVKILLHENGSSIMFGNAGYQFENFARKRLLENHADKEEVQELLIRATSSLGDRERWQELYDANTPASTKAVAASRIAFQFFQKIGNACLASEKQQEFDIKFATFDKLLNQVEKHVNDFEPKWRSSMLTQLEYYKQDLESKTNPPKIPAGQKSSSFRRPKVDESRATKTLKRIQVTIDFFEEKSKKD